MKMRLCLPVEVGGDDRVFSAVQVDLSQSRYRQPGVWKDSKGSHCNVKAFPDPQLSFLCF